MLGFKKAEVLRGPFDPGGQPETRTGDQMELGFFAWNIKGGMTASKGVLKNPSRYQDFWHWDSAVRLVQLSEKVGFDYQVPFERQITTIVISTFSPPRRLWLRLPIL